MAYTVRKSLPSYSVNGWAIHKCPNSFAERYAYEATAVDAEGYRAAYHGFQSLRDAKAFCNSNTVPDTRK